MSFHRSKNIVLAATAAFLISTAKPISVQADPLPQKPGAAFAVQDNARFATVASGFASVIGIELGANATPAQLASARQRALLVSTIPQAARERSTRMFRRIGALGPGTPLSNIRIVAYTKNGQLPLRAIPSAAAAPKTGNTASAAASSNITARSITTKAVSPLSFKYNGFSGDQVTNFSAYRDTAYPLMVQVYGDPAPSQQGKTVIIQADSTAGDGIYELPPSDPTSTSGGTIRYDPVTATGSITAAQALSINNYNLTRLMLIAFHGAQLMAYDSWERGFADAAALVVAYKAAPSATFDPSQLGVYLLPVYDILNRPELGNPYFFAPNTSPNLGFYRLGMAQAAWLKAWIENPNFFANFNSSYYAQYDANLPGNTAALKGIAAGLIPTIEGLGFNDWYRRQYVLDTAVTTGEKLWLAVIPLANQTSGDTRSVFFGVAQHYSTASNGDETPLAGIGTVSAINELGLDTTTRSAELRNDTRAIFNELGEAELNSQNVAAYLLPIIGFEATGTPDSGRLIINLNVNSAEASAVFPYNVAGTTAAPSGFYGATIGAEGGSSLSIVSNGVAQAAPVWTRGAYKSAATYPTGPNVKTTYSFAPTGEAARSVVRNSAWSYFGGMPQSLAAIFEARSAGSAVPVSLTNSGSNKLHMMSLPLYPVQSDEAAALGVSPDSLFLARYLTTDTPSGFGTSGIQFGVTSEKHDLYPNISEPFAPGRGYWMQFDSQFNTTVQGSQPPQGSSFKIPLRGGWTQIGTPFNLAFAMAAVQVTYNNGTPVSFATAVQNGWLGAGVWRWKPEGGYTRVDVGSAADQQLAPFEGYYIFSCYPRGVKLVFNPSAAQTTALTTAPNTANNWQLRVSVTEETATDSGSLGVSDVASGQPLRRAAAKPPSGPRVPTLGFISSGNATFDATKAGNASGWADSYIPTFTAATTASWRFVVDGTTSGKTESLTWGDIASLPVSYDMALIDEQTGQRIVMAQAGSAVTNNYSYVSDGAARVFRIEAKANSLRINVTSPANGAILR